MKPPEFLWKTRGRNHLFRRLFLTAVLLSTTAQAMERWDHRGAVGLLTAVGLDVQDRVKGEVATEQAGRFAGILGGTWAIGNDGNEVKLFVQAFARGGTAWAISAGYGGYFGQERFKTFYDLDGRFDLSPVFTVGPRVGLGLQYEATQTIGVFAMLATRIGVGNGWAFSGEAFVGVQLRTYLLE